MKRLKKIPAIRSSYRPYGEPVIASAIKTENFAKDKMNLHVHNKVAGESVRLPYYERGD